MKMTLSTSQAVNMLTQDTDANWSYQGAKALIEYLEEIDEDMELNVVAIRCDYSEYSSLQEWAEDYFSGDWKEQLDMDAETADDDEIDEAIREYIQDHGTLIEFDGGIIVSQF